MSSAEAKAAPEKNDERTVAPLTGESVFVITDLAIWGLKYIKAAVDHGDFDKMSDDPAEAKEIREHYRVIAESAGPDAVESLKRMCRYIVGDPDDGAEKGKEG